MASTTGIELGPNTCLLAGVRPIGAGSAEVFALRRMVGLEWRADSSALTDSLQTTLQGNGFPRHATVVAWNTAEDAIDRLSPSDVVAPIEAAGFHVVSVLTPTEALTRLAAVRRRGAPAEAIAWLALNTHGAAIAIVRDTELLFSRTFSWTFNADLPTVKAQLLQRYLLIAHLAPELSRGIALVRDARDLPVELAITCGDLPDLRSLTMPLIEELDLEVETLDSTDGLRATRSAKTDLFAELAPGIRLATAAALDPLEGSHRHSTVAALARWAAAAAVIITVAWVGYSYWHTSRAPVSHQAITPDRAALQTSGARVPPDRVAPAARGESQPREPRATQESPSLPVATGGSREPIRALSAPKENPQSAAEQPRAVPSDRTIAAMPPSPTSVPPLLKEPLPRIDSVLIDQDRRLMIVDGAVIGVGDTIGSRVVTDITRDAILLREPSGRIVRVRPRVGMTPWP